MLSLFLALLPQSPSALGADDAVLRLATTGASVKIGLPGLAIDSAQLAGLKKRYGDRGVLQGKFRGGDATVTAIAAYGAVQSSKTWRETLMEGKLVGLGQFDVGTTACAEQLRELEKPYSDLGWHAFLTLADTCIELRVFTLVKGDVTPFKRTEFEHTVAAVRYAIVRLGSWDEMPIPVLDRMHEGLTRPTNDGPTYLRDLAGTAPDGWACALAAAEIGRSMSMGAKDRIALYDRALGDLKKIPTPSKLENFAQLTAMSGRAIALRDDNQLAPALAEMKAARELPAAQTTAAKTALSYDMATIHALSKDAVAAVACLRESMAGDPDRRAFATRDASFAPIADDKPLLTLLKTGK